ncbi:MAG: hypothetical protein V1738_05180 [Patescibacteria group bacterium]
MKKIFTLALVMGLLLPVWPVSAETTPSVTTVTVDTPYVTNNFVLTIKAGSVYENLQHDGDSIFVTVPADEAFEFRTIAPDPYRLENNVGLSVCNVTVGRENQLVITGPVTANILPSALRCDTSDIQPEDTSLLSVSEPTSAAVLTMGETAPVMWIANGRLPAELRLRLSVDGGESYSEPFADHLFNDGYHEWLVPEVTTTSEARLKIEGLDGGRVISLAVSANFTILGLTPIVPPSETETIGTTYVPSEATAKAATISIDKNLVPNTSTVCHPNSRIKTATSASLYYCGTDGKRYVFPNQKTHDTWYSDFAGVIDISEATMAKIAIGGNVTYRPGVRLVKVQTDPSVFAVDADGTLRWVPDEATAARLYGPSWNQTIDDVPDAFFVNYKIGEPLE